MGRTRGYNKIVAKILLIAPTCDGQDVGEAWVAFQWAKLLPMHHQVTLLTYHKRGKSPVRRQLNNLRIVEWTEPPLLGRNERLNSMLKPAYPWFYYRARRWIKRALADGEKFDIIHQTTPVAMRYPSPGVGLGVPFVIGPVGGGLDLPPGFGADSDTAPWFVRLRGLDKWRLRHDPLLRRTYRIADCVLGIAPYVRDLLSDIQVRRFEVMSETALQTVPEPIDRSQHRTPVKLLYVGRVIRTKGARDIIQALASLRDLDTSLDIVGDGPDRQFCEKLADDHGLGSAVTFHGMLPRTQVDVFYREADIFVFPSFREPGGNVIPEAMGFGLPSIVVNRGGPGSATDDSCAIRLRAETPEQLVRDLANAIRRLVVDGVDRLELGRSARQQVVEKGLWSAKMAEIDALYSSILDVSIPPELPSSH